ncbi:MAG: hypothetical protein R3C68_08940 [Myxococcota bacterium]
MGKKCAVMIGAAYGDVACASNPARFVRFMDKVSFVVSPVRASRIPNAVLGAALVGVSFMRRFTTIRTSITVVVTTMHILLTTLDLSIMRPTIVGRLCTFIVLNSARAERAITIG